jgi:secondary thiamine-phosphate synthase enzyme
MMHETMQDAIAMVAAPECISRSDGALKTRSYLIRVTTQKPTEFVDITSHLKACVDEADLSNGMVTVFSRHTTACVKINENEPLLLQDMADFLERMSPRYADYRHNDFTVRTVNMTEDECPNGHAHCQSLLLSGSETIPLIEGQLLLGRWQSVFLIELDHPRSREVVVQVMGE